MSGPPSGKSSASTAIEEKLSELKEKLRELFQLDRGDLDFGLYRIMGRKSAEVSKFLDDDLLPQVTEALDTVANSSISASQKELGAAVKTLGDLDVDPEESTKVKELRAELKAAQDSQRLEADVYNHLCNFFSRYYDEGDFMSLRRYKSEGREAYSVPYNGEELKLHWANSDQYYIKTTESYASYVFIVGTGDTRRRVRFEIAAADNEQDNIKESNEKVRCFVLSRHFLAEDEGELVIRFDHRPLSDSEKIRHPQNGGRRQQSINDEAERRIIKKLATDWATLLVASCPTDANGERTVLGKHLTRYTAKNSFDYFIHKDLGAFLRRELDYYLKSQIISIDNLELSSTPAVYLRELAQVKVLKKIGGKIIDFLAQLEDFQKTLWLKKKFVLETQYCMTLDKVPDSLYAEIAENEAQRKEWVELFAIDELNGDLAATAYSKPLRVAFLKEHPCLVLDTRHFDKEFVDRLLANLSTKVPIDEQTDGLLIHGENFQALNLMQERYRDEVRCIYIDPPYNTDASTILYKNGYKKSSWLSLMRDRAILARPMLEHDGIMCVAIDDEEVSGLRAIMETNFATELGIATVRSNPAGRKTKGRFAPAHEYALFYNKTEGSSPGYLEKTEEQKRSYPKEDEQGRFMWTNLIRSGTNDRRQDRPKQFYPIFVNDKDEIHIPKMEWDEISREWVLKQSKADTEIAVYPIRKIGGECFEGNWHRGHQRVVKSLSEYRVRRSSSGDIAIDFKARMDERSLPKTWWDKSQYSTANGTIQLAKIFGRKDFDFPKSVDLVKDCLTCSINGGTEARILDYFAGSGTTGHAVIDLNREDDGRRKYILVEVGHHFKDVLLPRMKKIVYSKEWKDGKPQDRKGISQIIKYIRLESYEDTLDSLEMTPREELFASGEKSKAILEDYRLRYALSEETAASASLCGEDFIDPFSYTISVVRDGVRRDERVDLAETFNFLLGLRVVDRRRLDDVLAITGTTKKCDNCLVLWRNLNEMDASGLDKWFAKYRATFGNDLHRIYVNGDHTLNAAKKADDEWEAITTEPVFKELMFEATA